MRIAEVVGKFSLLKVHPSLVGKRWILGVPQTLASLAGREPSTADEVAILDELGAGPGDRIAFSEGAEAAFPFHPEKKPVGAYNAGILDEVVLDRQETERLLGK